MNLIEYGIIMRHCFNRFKLNRTSSHRKAMMANMAVSLARHEKIQTTVAKAKFLRPFFESLITIAKKENKLHALRLLNAKCKNEETAKKMIHEIALRYSSRNGGYLRIIKIGLRKGDCAEMAIIELV